MSDQTNPPRADPDLSSAKQRQRPEPCERDQGPKRRFDLQAWRITLGHLALHAVSEPHNQTSRRWRQRIVQAAVVIAMALGAAQAAAQTGAGPKDAPLERAGTPASDVEKRADDAFSAGVAAYRRGDYAAAREAFAQAYELDPSYRAAAVLGQTEEKLGNLAQAASLLNWALYHLDGRVEPEAKARMDADLLLLKNRVLTLKLVTEVPFQEVLIDDLLFTSGSVRLLPEGNNTWTIYLDSASHEVIVRSEGYLPQQRQVSAPAGTSIDWQLRWQRELPATQEGRAARISADVVQPTKPVAIDRGADPDESVPWQLPVAIASGGLALVGAGFGIYSFQQYSGASKDLDAAKSSLVATDLAEPCRRDATASTRPMCDAMAAAADARVTHGNRAIAAFSAAGALALSSAAFWIWRAHTDDVEAARWTVSPVVGTAYWGGAVGRQF